MNGNTIPDSIVRVLSRANALYLDNHFTITSLSEFGVDHIKELRFCIVSECHSIQSLIDGKEDETESIQPFIERPSIHCLWNLRSICEGVVPQGSFNELRFLLFHACTKLTYVFTNSVLRNLSNLQDLVVEDCASVKGIIKLEAEDYSDEEIVVLSLPRLKKLRFQCLPELVSIGNGSWPSLEQIKI